MAVPKRAKVRDWLYELSSAVRRATQRALLAREPGRTVRMGASGAPTSAMDEIAEQVILAKLPDAPIPLNLLSEEVGIVHNGAEWWLVSDPVDGSRNALRGIPFYCASLAIGSRDLASIEMGLVESMVSPDSYWAEKGKGATHGNQKIRTRPMRPDEVVLGTALDYEKGKLALPGDRRVHYRDLGSAALEMCLVAQGALDGFVSHEPLVRVVDVAAGTLIVREAGGVVQDLNGRELNAPFDPRHRFPMVAFGDPKLRSVVR